jgi:hypothetical protein
MSTTAQDNNFGASFLEQVVDFVYANFKVEDVFSESEIVSYARSLNPEDVFSDDVLSKWAEENGFAKEE